MSKRYLFAAAAALLMLAKTAVAEIHVQEAWSPAMPAGVNQVPVYLVLTNLGQETDRLIAASTDVAEKVHFQASQAKEGQLEQLAIEQIALPPFLPVGLTMSSAYIVLDGLQQGLRPGGRYNLTLQFADAPEQTVRVRVRATNFFGVSVDGGRSDPLQTPGGSRRSEGFDEIRSDPFIR